MWYSVRPEILHLVSTSGVSAFFYTSSITTEHIYLFGRYSQEGWWTLCTYFKMCIIVLWGTAEGNLRLDGRAGIQRVLSALSDQLAEGNDLNVNDLLACLTLSIPRFPLLPSFHLCVEEKFFHCRQSQEVENRIGSTEAGGSSAPL